MAGNAPVIGLDNKSPVYNPEGLWQVWNMNQVYLGTMGDKKSVPKVGDVVVEITGRSKVDYIVHAIDPITFVPVLLPVNNNLQTTEIDADDILFGVGPGTVSETYRVYIDESVTPFRLTVDKRLRIHGSTCSSVKIFKGRNTSNGGIVISRLYDQNGTFTTDIIPLEVVSTDNLTNLSTKSVSTAFTQNNLEDGELVTVVAYDANGFVVSKRQCLVEKTGFVNGTDAFKKYVTHISLETPFLSITTNKLIEYPINVPLNTLNLMGVVHYSDGSIRRMSVDGDPFTVMGLDNYSASIVGEQSQLVLKYDLLDSEYGVANDARFITDVWNIRTVTTNGHYGTQLFCYPVWINEMSGYSLEWYLYDLNRSASYLVTNKVVYSANKPVFNPLQYGVKQTLSVSVNLRLVNGNYNNFNHVQFVDVTLNKHGSGRPDIDNVSNWSVSQVSSSGLIYGNDEYATYKRENANLWHLRLAPEHTVKAIWLEKVYKNNGPLFDPVIELKAPEPTHFVVLGSNGVNQEFSISQWNSQLDITSPLTNNNTLFVKFINRTIDTDLQLAIVGFNLFQVDTNGNFV